MAILRGTDSKSVYRRKKKKKEEEEYKSPPAGTAGRGGAPVYTPPKVAKPKPPPKPKREADIPMAPMKELQEADPLPLNIANLTQAANNIYGPGKLTPDRAMELLSVAERGYSTSEWGKFLSPMLAADPFTHNLRKVLSDYYRWTGRLPSPQKARELTESRQLDQGGAADQIDDRPPPQIFNDKGDLTLFDILSDHANDKAALRMDNDERNGENQRRGRWSQNDLKNMPGDPKTETRADRLRALANQPMRTLGKTWDGSGDSEMINQRDREAIDAARGWYVGTSVKGRVLENQAERVRKILEAPLQNPDGTDNRDAVNLLAQLTGMKNGDFKTDPTMFVNLRDDAFGKKYGDLDDETKDSLKIFGAKLAAVFPEMELPEDEKWIWNPNFDKHASLYIFMYNIPFAVRENPFKKDEHPEKWEREERRKKAATANISIATYGGVETTDDLREWMKSMGFQGDKNKNDTFPEQFTQFLFEDAYMKTHAEPNEPLAMSMARYIEMMGAASLDDPALALPKKYQQLYREQRSRWAETVAAAMEAEYGDAAIVNPLNAVFEAEHRQLQAAREAYGPAIESLQANQDIEDALVEGIRGQRQDLSVVKGSRERVADNVYDLTETGKIILGETTGSGKGKIGRAGRTLSIDPNNDLAMYIEFTVAPTVESVIPAVINKIEYWKARNDIFLSLIAQKMNAEGEFTGEYGDYATPRSALAGTAPGGKHLAEIGAAAVRESEPGKLTTPAKFGLASDLMGVKISTDVRHYKWSHLSNAWIQASEEAKNLHEYPHMKREFEEWGLDPQGEHQGLLFWANLRYSISADLGLDVILTKGAGTLLKGYAGFMRGRSSYQIKRTEDLAAKAVHDVVDESRASVAELAKRQEALLDTARSEESIAEVTLSKAKAARSRGDSSLADELTADANRARERGASWRRRASAEADLVDPSLRPGSTWEEQLYYDLQFAASPKERTIMAGAAKETALGASARADAAASAAVKQSVKDAKAAEAAIRATPAPSEVKQSTGKAFHPKKKVDTKPKTDLELAIDDAAEIAKKELDDKGLEAWTAGGGKVTVSKELEDAQRRVSRLMVKDAQSMVRDLRTKTDYADALIMYRPHWFDTLADGLASAELTGLKVELFLGLKSSHVGQESASAFNKILAQIGKSKNADEIVILMNRLRVNYLLNVDPGALWLGKLHNYAKITGGSPFSKYTTAFPNEVRIADGARDVTKHAYDLGFLTRMGLAKGNEAEANRLMYGFVERLHNIDRSMPAFKVNSERLKIWNEMNDLIQANLRSRKVTKVMLDDIAKNAKRAGMETRHLDQHIRTEWDAYNAFRIIKNWKRSKPDLIGEDGKALGAWYDDLQSDVPYLLAGRGRQGYTYGQMAHDLVSKFNMQDLIGYQTGKAWSHMKRSTPMHLFGKVSMQGVPTFAGMANAGRTLATATMSFPVSAVFIDEAWRYIPEILTGRMGLRGLKEAKAITKGHGLRMAASDAFESTLKQAREIVPLGPDDPMYREAVYRWLQAFGDQEFAGEYMLFLRQFDDELLGQMTPQQITELFKRHLIDHVVQPENADLLAVLSHTGRGPIRPAKPPAAIKAAQDEWDDMLKGLDDTHGELTATRDELVKEIRELRSEKVTLTKNESVVVQPELPQKRRASVLPEAQRVVGDSPEFNNALLKFYESPTVANFNALRNTADRNFGTLLGEQRELLEGAREAAKGAAKPAAKPAAATGFKDKVYKQEGRAKNAADSLAAKDTGTAYHVYKDGDTFTLTTTKRGGSDTNRVHTALRDAPAEEVVTDIPEAVFKAGKGGRPDTLKFTPASGEKAETWFIDGSKHAGGWRVYRFGPDGKEMPAGTFSAGRSSMSSFNRFASREEARAAAEKQIALRTKKTAEPPIEKIDDIADAPMAPPPDPAAPGAPKYYKPATYEKRIRDMEKARATLWRTVKGEKVPILPPRNLPQTEIVTGTLKGRTTTVGEALKVTRPLNRSYIYKWLREKGHYTPQEYPPHPPDWAMGPVFKNQAEVKVFFKQNNFPEELLDDLMWDHRADVLAMRGLTDDVTSTGLTNGMKLQHDELAAKIASARSRVRNNARERRWHISEPRPRDNKLSKAGMEYIEDVADRLAFGGAIPPIARAMRDGKKISRRELKGIIEKYNMPNIMGARGHKTGWLRGSGELGFVPLVTKFGEVAPYRALNWMGNKTRQGAFLGNFSVEYRRMLAAGWKTEEAKSAATYRALDYVEKVMYIPGMTPTENNMGHLAYFLPAFRQATIYWAKLAARHPVLMAGLQQTLEEEMPMAWLGDYGAYIPLPFWAQNSALEAGVPGLSMPLLVPLKFFNMLTGWDRVVMEEGDPDIAADDKRKWVYTGETTMDWLSDGFLSPLTGFASKRTAAFTAVDDLLWTVGGENSFLGTLETESRALSVLYTMGMAFRKDPIARRRGQVSVQQALMANGIKPDATAFEAMMAGSPSWYAWMSGYMADPAAGLGLITRQFFFRKISYSPSDIEAAKDAVRDDGLLEPADEKTRNLWKKINVFQDEEARTMGGAEYEYYQAEGDAKKQDAILAKYPKLAKKFDFFKLDAYDRQEKLLDEKNLWLVPYVSGKYMYGADGAPLTNDEFHRKMTTGAMIRASNADYLDKVDRLITNIGWSRSLKEAEGERDDRIGGARKFLKDMIKKHSENPDKHLKDLMGYEEKWWGWVAPTEWDDGPQRPSKWMVYYAMKRWGKDYLKHQLEWDIGAIHRAHSDILALKGEEGREVFGVDGKTKRMTGLRPYGSDFDGVEGYYTNDAVGKASREAGVGTMNRISDAISSIMDVENSELFDKKNSISWQAIKEKTKENEEKRDYRMLSILEKPYYFMSSAEEIESALPGIFDGPGRVSSREEMNILLYKAEELYEAKINLIDKTNPSWSEEEKIQKKYNEDLKKLMKASPAGAVFENGRAGTLLHSWLADPGGGKKWDKKFSARVTRELLKDKPDYVEIVESLPFGGTTRPEKKMAANAWASIFNASIALRIKVDEARTADEGKIGKTKDAGIAKLLRYADEWAKNSRRFRSQWFEQGGEKMVRTILLEKAY